VYEFICAECAEFPVTKMCDWLEVSRSGYYDWLSRPTSPTETRRDLLAVQVRAIFEASRGTYGARRIARVLRHAGETISLRLIRWLMAENGLVAAAPRPYKRTTIPDQARSAVPDRVRRDFTATRPGSKLVGDITYLRTWEGWLYLATVIDCHTRKVIGWAMAEHMRAELIGDALKMAAINCPFAEVTIFHSDRGTQYTSSEFAKVCKDLGVLQSMGRTGICWDNALAESFFASLKNELVYRTAFPTRKKARLAIAEYVEVFYNRQRLHSAIGYRTPAEVEAEYYRDLIAA
jgi:putative transposase